VTRRGTDGPDEHRTSEAELDERHSTQDERAQDALAELGLGDEQRSQPSDGTTIVSTSPIARASMALKSGLPES
jgi:hypothetical protein